jgi:hypothetical protein
MGVNDSAALQAMRADADLDEEVLRCKRKVIACLARLPNDESRRRVIAAVAILTGHTEVPRS